MQQRGPSFFVALVPHDLGAVEKAHQLVIASVTHFA